MRQAPCGIYFFFFFNQSSQCSYQPTETDRGRESARTGTTDLAQRAYQELDQRHVDGAKQGDQPTVDTGEQVSFAIQSDGGGCLRLACEQDLAGVDLESQWASMLMAGVQGMTSWK